MIHGEKTGEKELAKRFKALERFFFTCFCVIIRQGLTSDYPLERRRVTFRHEYVIVSSTDY